MKKTTLTFFLFCVFCLPLLVFSQEKASTVVEKCATDKFNAQQLAQFPNMMGSPAFEAMVQERINNTDFSKTSMAVVTIPLVVHVLHNGEAEGVGANISDAQVLSQITVMNQDFRRMAGTPGYNTNAVGADVEVEFELAKQTEDGCPTDGINRVNICQDGVSSFAEMDSYKTQTIWDSSRYMNMWSSKYVGALGGILGFAQFPGGNPTTDGVSANYTTFGSSDYDTNNDFALNAPYDKGRTMTHEVGHYLGLYHTFQGGCNGVGDEVSDTPPVAAPNYGCPTGIDSCNNGTLDMVENYMDYTDDLCMNIYTIDQKARVTAVITGPRSGLVAGTNNALTVPSPVTNDASATIENLNVNSCGADFTPEVRVYNYGTTTMTSATLTYDVDVAGTQVYNWTGSLAEGQSEVVTLPTVTSTGGEHTFNTVISNPNGATDARACNDVSEACLTLTSIVDAITVELTIVPDNYGSETTWSLTDGSNNVVYSGGPYADNDSTPIVETFNVNNECYTFVIYDQYNDGICCNYGNGSYELKTDAASGGAIIFTGGSFASSETTKFSVNSLSTDDFAKSNTISLYPNPTQNVLNIKVANTNALPDGFKIYNMLGQLVKEATINSINDLKVNTASYSNGMYFIKINKDNNSVTLPFIKK
ncbi:T9SS type A sorting domain-containing protein [Bizionia gelidisalsuginis]|uniref:T9SS type A sorting domain-containing protein n=2 Tax=Bizionia TaxID=283785 RepID=A0A8H2LHK3_9FLAO|nr:MULTISPECIES: M43 family zinc metalloprotease [Bizionia]TYB76051.1 T9SS type A sorting domain-containing protein [Bizionia saleffrena]TYC13554.1 T9SS type A sorting domain-containing protein [Bizionia gelidisalsuginis]